MDFDLAARRLARDQSKLKQKRGGVGAGGSLGGGKVSLSVSAKRQAEQARAQAERRAAEKRALQQERRFQEHYLRSCERKLGVRSLLSPGSTAKIFGSSSNNNKSNSGAPTTPSIKLIPTSIYGQGDKIALPPSILEFLTNTNHATSTFGQQGDSSAIPSGPWTFRVGLLNPYYTFPASPALNNMKQPTGEDGDDESSANYDDHMSSDDECDNDDKVGCRGTAVYLDEMRYKYLAYTHATVVEFTQEDGHIGLPEPIAMALLQDAATKLDVPVVKTMRTVDPASVQTSVKQEDFESSAMDTGNDEDDEKTPGHLAWGAFDLPDMPIEVSLVHLPKGKACTLIPTDDAIRNGFYNLKDIKLVLEQSLIRTRATLSVGDVVQTWHRGSKFDLKVATVKPSTFNAVLCINTDIEVEFGANENFKEGVTNDRISEPGGRTLASATATANPPSAGTIDNSQQPKPMQNMLEDLIPEPPASQTENICAVQIQAGGIAQINREFSRRRFDISVARVKDLFQFAHIRLVNSAGGGWSAGEDFRMVTRFPRRVLTMDSAPLTLAEAGIQPGQELFIVERV